MDDLMVWTCAWGEGVVIGHVWVKLGRAPLCMRQQGRRHGRVGAHACLYVCVGVSVCASVCSRGPVRDQE